VALPDIFCATHLNTNISLDSHEIKTMEATIENKYHNALTQFDQPLKCTPNKKYPKI